MYNRTVQDKNKVMGLGVLFNIAMSCKILHKDDHAVWKCHMAWYLLICTAVYMVSGVYFVVCGDIYTFSFIYYLSWLMVMAYIDHHTGYVYDCMEYAVIFPVVLSAASMYDMHGNKECAVSFIVSVLVYYAAVRIMSHLGCMGEGDGDVLIFNSLMMTPGMLKDIYTTGKAGYAVMECIIGNMAFMMLALFLFTIKNIKYLKLKNLSLKERRPFLPSIYMAAVLCLFVKIGFTFLPI